MNSRRDDCCGHLGANYTPESGNWAWASTGTCRVAADPNGGRRSWSGSRVQAARAHAPASP